MSDLLQDLDTYFNTVGAVTAETVFYDRMLDSPDTAIALYEYAGSSPMAQIEGVTRSIQVVVRAKDVVASKKKANQLYKALMTEDGIINFTEERWCMITLRQPPFKMKIDGSGREYYCFNVGVVTYID